jgi:hypothetical protein
MARPDDAAPVRDAVRPLGEILEFEIDESGLTVPAGTA